MKVLIKNIGQIASGDIRTPRLDADSIVIVDGRIAAVGRGLDEDADTVVDARGTTVMPGLIDSHVHPVFGDFTPRQRTMDFIDSGMHGGVTTAISAGEVHLPGRPKDIVGLKALAETIATLKREGLTIVLSEQNLAFARRLADRAYIIEKGQIKFEGTFADLDANPEIRRTYLSVG